MIDDLKPYLEYKNSGVPWLGVIPSLWETKRGKALFAESHLPVRDRDEIVTCFRDGQVTLRRNRRTSGFMMALYEAGYQGVRRGQLVIHAMDAFAGAIGVSDSDGKCTPEYIVCVPRCADILPGYFALTLRFAAHQGFILASCPAVRERAPRFRYPHLGEMQLPLPPAVEQIAIVRFLDHANGKIERAIRAKKKLIALLNEQKQAILHRAVTRGLDPSVKLKPSGIAWLGHVPEHWTVKRLKWVTRLQRGYDLPSDRRKKGVFPVVSSGGVIDSHNESRAHGPGVVMGRYGSTDAVFYIEQDFWPHNTALFVTNFQGNLPKWCYYLLRTVSKTDHSSKSAVPGVDRKDLYEIYVPQPPVAEQASLVDGIEQQSAVYTVTISRAEREIALLREYRTTLTADVVTGKLDVREAVKHLPAEVEEAHLIDDLDGPEDAADSEGVVNE